MFRWKTQRNEAGQILCRWCGVPVTAKNRKFWCSEACVAEYRSINDPNYIASQLLKRDNGVCACCGVNAEQLQRMCSGFCYGFTDLWPAPDHYAIAGLLGFDSPYLEGKVNGRWSFNLHPDVEAAFEIAKWHFEQARQEYEVFADDLRRESAAKGFPDTTSRRWWEADHIVEVVRGGGLRGLENYQTLCVPCHKAKTRKLAKDRAQERAQERQAKSPQLDLIAA